MNFIVACAFNHGTDDDYHFRLFRRQSGTTADIGHTQHLNDTHYHGLVHWTGYPSEVLFILTRSRVTGHSSESWLWRSESNLTPLCVVIVLLLWHRSTDYGHSFSNDTMNWADNTVIEWYYIAPLNEYVSGASHSRHNQISLMALAPLSQKRASAKLIMPI